MLRRDVGNHRVTRDDRSRVAVGGHSVPETKIRERYARLWPLVATAITVVDTAVIYDNSRARTPFRVVATFRSGLVVGEQHWPAWAPGPFETPAAHKEGAGQSATTVAQQAREGPLVVDPS